MLYRYFRPIPVSTESISVPSAAFYNTTVNYQSASTGYYTTNTLIDLSSNYGAIIYENSSYTDFILYAFSITNSGGSVSISAKLSSVVGAPSSKPAFCKYSPDGNYLIVGFGTTLYLYSTGSTFTLLGTKTFSALYSSAIAWYPDSSCFAYSFTAGEITLQQVSSGGFGTLSSIACNYVMALKWVNNYLIASYSSSSFAWNDSYFSVFSKIGNTLNTISTGNSFGPIGQVGDANWATDNSGNLFINAFPNNSDLGANLTQNQYCLNVDSSGNLTNLSVVGATVSFNSTAAFSTTSTTYLPNSNQFVSFGNYGQDCFIVSGGVCYRQSNNFLPIGTNAGWIAPFPSVNNCLAYSSYGALSFDPNIF